MLFYSTINSAALQLLKKLQGLEALQDFSLVGGTSLALQIGHRISIDLDLFSSSPIAIATIPDIAAMKLAAITGRGSKKDFIDLYFILKTFSLPELFKFYALKYPDGPDF